MLTGRLFACLLAVLVAGCGGGPGDGELPQEQAPAEASRTVEIVARTGPVVAVQVGRTANLSDLNSYTSSDQPLSFQWSFSSRPDGSNAVLQNATAPNPSFIADVWGDYRVQLFVNAEGIDSERAVQLVVATVSPEPPTGRANHEGLSSNCVVCHSDEIDATPGPGKIPGKSLNHIGASSMCETCHTPQGFDIVPFVDHQEVFGNCSGCHNNVLAVGKSEFHQPTNAECDDCHNTTSFFELGADGKFDHTGITSGCAGCHNGSTAIGKTPTTDNPPRAHPITNSDCISCHTTASFLGAFPDHTDPAIIGPGCSSCHGISSTDNITDPPVGHPVMTRTDGSDIDCGYCHGIATFSLNIANGEGGQFNHGLVDPALLTCITCHNATNSINAPGRTPVPPAGTHPDRVDCESCHTTDAFNPPIGVDHNAPAVLAARCDSCHDGVTATGQPADLFGPGNTLIYAHMQTTITNPPQNPPDRDCGDCHTPGTFMTGTFDHDLSFYSPQPACEDCHNNVITLGKLGNHIPTTQDCGACHLDTIDFRGATVNHATLSPAELTNCVSCHNGNIATGKQLSTHLPTDMLANENCFECHNVPNTDLSFADASNFFHNDINGNCESCHSGNPNYVAIGAIAKKTNHIPALNECVVCHAANTTNPGDFSPAVRFLPNVHDAITNGCEGCHIARFLPLPSPSGANLIKDVSHVPTSQDCGVCHSNAVGGFMQSTMLAHEGITGNCVSCHNGNFTGVGTIGARAKTPSPPAGKHPVTFADCVSCHDTTDFANASVDHNSPAVLAARCDSCHDGFQPPARGKIDKPNHVSTTEDCGVCHIAGGNFKPAVFTHTGIVDNCASCHVADGTGSAIGMDDGHITTPEDCSVCHNTTAFAGARFDHQLIGINDICESCHNGFSATGKSNFHVPTNGDCRDCHQTTGFKPSTFSHAGIVDNCSSCHDAGFATPKKTNHVPTNQDCGVCHNTSVFKPATFNHTGITNNCVSCHDGTTATGMMDAVPDHISTSLDCSSCHTTATFADGTWTHDASSVGICESCHNGSTATGKIDAVPTHLLTTVECDVCHTTNGWAPTSFSHSRQGDYPGNHRNDPGCKACHGSSISATIPYRWLKYAPDCAACHANDFERKGDHIGGENGTVSRNRNCAGSGCHRVSDRKFD